jgi:murein DD-endopeptidase MepM/ murein hydrolase activator NlpD
MSDRPRHLTHVVRRAPPGGRRPRSGFTLRQLSTLAVVIVVPIVVCLTVFSLAQSSLATAYATRMAPPATHVTSVSAAVPATPTPEPPQPTSTFLAPSPTPTAIILTRSTRPYKTLSGDTLPALAARFGVNPQDIRAPFGLQSATLLQPGQLVDIPDVLNPDGLSPAIRLAPDSEIVFGPSASGFDPVAFAAAQGGYLAHYRGFVEGVTRSGGDVVRVVALQHSIHPRMLMALLEHMGGWVTNPQPGAEALTRPLGYEHPYRDDLAPQLNWAANQLAIGYYGWRAGTLTELTFPNGTRLRLEPTLNAGTVAVQYFFAQLYDRPEWEAAVGPEGFAATYRRLFGDPFALAVDPLLPADLTQPPLALPFRPGQNWYFSGGPHGAWENGGAQAALDFAPSSVESGCAESNAWVTAMAAGEVIRSEGNAVLLDLDGDSREATGWVLFYFHIAEKDRVAAGTIVEVGDRIGHPSCEGGRSTGTHVHIARKYNGEWMLAGGPAPFNLAGWVAAPGGGEYQGILARAGQTIEACACTAAWTAVVAEP